MYIIVDAHHHDGGGAYSPPVAYLSRYEHSARALQRRSATHKEEMQVGYYDEASAATHIYLYIYTSC